MNDVRKGKFIVIEGGDGSGKATQAQLLIDYCKQQNIPHAYVDFPNYDSFFGQMVGAFLRGEYGNLESVSPYLASLLFALDRREMKEQIQKELNEGKVIIANRYVSSNMAHQGSKYTNIEERNKFLKWLNSLEFDVHGLPKEDLIVLLHVPWDTAEKLTQQKAERGYLKGEKQDIQEKDLNHRKSTEEMYNYLSSQNTNWVKIECTKNDTLLTKLEIHQAILDVLSEHHIF